MSEMMYERYLKKGRTCSRIQYVRRTVIFTIAILLECIIGAVFVGSVINTLVYCLICGVIAFCGLCIDKELDKYLSQKIDTYSTLATFYYMRMQFEKKCKW